MATTNKGILGGVSGGIGTVVGAKSKGSDTLRSKPRKNKKKRPVLPQNSKLGSMSTFISKFKKVIDIGWNKKGDKNDPRSLAMKYNLANAVTGKDAQIDYQKVKFSDGTRERVWSEEILFEKGRKITINWDVPEILNAKVIGKDVVHIVFYDETENYSVYTEAGSVRGDYSKTYIVPEEYLGNTLHAWIFFVSPDGKTVSDSDYLGSGIVFD